MLDLYVMSGGKKLRCGYTTGSCATAATKAATIMLFNDVILENVEITTPKGIKIIIPINSVEKGKDYCIVSVIKDGGDDPDITNGIFILASHSGWGRTAYFTNLDKLKIDDSVFIYYKGKKYVYQIIETYVVNKTGEVSIHRDPTHTQLALTTCSNTNDKEQLVVMANLISKDDYS